MSDSLPYPAPPSSEDRRYTLQTMDGSTSATGLSLGTVGALVGFSTGSLAFKTSSKSAGTYTSLVSDAANPSTYTSGGNSYAVAYFYGSYTISPKTITSPQRTRSMTSAQASRPRFRALEPLPKSS